MSMDFNGREPEKPITDQEGVMFAAQPVWERSRKRKGFGGRKTATVAPEPRTFAAEADADLTLDRPVETPIASTPVYPRTEYAAMSPSTPTPSTLAAEEPVGLAAPIAGTRNTQTQRSTRSAKSNSVAPAAIAAAVVGLGALAAGGWYMSRDPAGVPELAAGTASESEMAATPLIPSNPPAQVAVNEAAPPPAVAAPRAETPAARTTARARPAAAASAGDTGVNASTTTVLPDGPQPYSASPGVAPTAPTEANPPLVTLPPQPVSEAPAAVPATPVATPEPAPTSEAPQPQTATPPQ